MRKSVTTAVTIITKEKEKDEIMVNNAKSLYPSSLIFWIDRKIELVTADLRSQHKFSSDLHRLSTENTLIISNYIIAMKTEIDRSDNYRRDNIRILYSLSNYNKNIPFKTKIRDDIISKTQI